ncbi:MAG: class I SAM-dependent methyltransferase [Ruminococcus sp.]|nr:class I SAM-dependent methyltransferase [Ruminococcus sp.]
MSFWDMTAWGYDLFETVFNGKCYNTTGKCVAQDLEKTDRVLECACGTGSITKYLAPACREIVATDMSKEMLRKAAKNCRSSPNIRFCLADITSLRCRDEVFDKVVAGNVIHLLDDPEKALRELMRVCKTGGKVIIPTYINMEPGGGTSGLITALDKAGAGFKRQFNAETYQEFFLSCGIENVKFFTVGGKIPCRVAVITKE